MTRQPVRSGQTPETDLPPVAEVDEEIPAMYRKASELRRTAAAMEPEASRHAILDLTLGHEMLAVEIGIDRVQSNFKTTACFIQIANAYSEKPSGVRLQFR